MEEDILPETFKMRNVPVDRLTPSGLCNLFNKPIPKQQQKKLQLVQATFDLSIQELMLGCDDPHWKSQEATHLKRELLKHNSYKRKRKHVKDYKHHVWKRDLYLDCVNYRNIRSQKVFLKEEYFDTYHPYTSCDIDWLNLPDVFICKGDCDEGVCMSCDWDKQRDASTGRDDPNFIEAWEYEDHWLRGKGLL